VNLYLRAKIGFCNCVSAIDDEEVDRVGDVDLVGSERAELGPGRPIGRALDEGAHFLNSDLVLHWAEATHRTLGSPGPRASYYHGRVRREATEASGGWDGSQATDDRIGGGFPSADK
jgi:hypothetical protein